MSTVGTDSVVVELRPPLPRSEWDWVQQKLDMALIDGQQITTEKGGTFDKMVFRGSTISAARLWKEKSRKLIYKGTFLEVKAVGIGSWDPIKFGANTYDRSATDVQFEFDMHEDNEMLANLKDMGRVLDSNESRDILDIIDELGEKLPAIQKCFEINAHSGKEADGEAGNSSEGTEYISVHGACKAMEALLAIRVNVEDLLLEIEDDSLMDVRVHSSTLRDPDSKHRPKLSYYQFLQLYLKLKRLKEEDPNIVSPRLSPRGKEEAEIIEKRKLVLGVGDSFGHGTGSLEGLSPRTIAAITGQESPSSVRSVSPRISSPRPLQHVGEAPPAAGLQDGGSLQGSPRLAGGAGSDSPRGYSPRRTDTNSVSARMGSARRAEKQEAENERVLKEFKESKNKKTGRDRAEDPKLDALRRKRIARLEGEMNMRKEMRGMLALSDRTDENGVVYAPASPNEGTQTGGGALFRGISSSDQKVPPLVLPSQRRDEQDKHGPGAMDRFIDQLSAKRHGALADDALMASHTHSALVHAPSTGPSGMQRRVVEKGGFPAVGVGSVEPRHWFITLNFWESVARFAPAFAPASLSVPSSSSSPYRGDHKRLWKWVRSTFASFDTECFYSSASSARPSPYPSPSIVADAKQDEQSRTQRDSGAREVRMFTSDLADVMAALRIRAKVCISERVPSYGSTDTGAGGGTLDLENYMHTEVLKTIGNALPGSHGHGVIGGGDGGSGSRDRAEHDAAGAATEQQGGGAAARIGSGEVYWAATPAWWTSQLALFRAKRDAEAVEEIANDRRKRKQRQLRSIGVKRVENMTQEQRREWGLLQEQEALRALEEDKERTRQRAFLSWAEFQPFFRSLTALAHSEAAEIRTVLAAELWLNTKHRAVHDVTLRFMRDKAYHARKRAESEMSAARERERLLRDRERRNADLYVGPSKEEKKEEKKEEEEKKDKEEEKKEDEEEEKKDKEEAGGDEIESKEQVERKEAEAVDEKESEEGRADAKQGSDAADRGEEGQGQGHQPAPRVKEPARSRRFFPGESDENIDRALTLAKDKAEAESRLKEGEGAGAAGAAGADVKQGGKEGDEAEAEVGPVEQRQGELNVTVQASASNEDSDENKNKAKEVPSASGGASSGEQTPSPSARERFKLAQLAKKQVQAQGGGRPGDVSPVVSPRIDTGPEKKEPDTPEGSSHKPQPPGDDAASGQDHGHGHGHVRAGQRYRQRENEHEHEHEHEHEESQVKEKEKGTPSMSARERFQLRHAQQQKEQQQEEERTGNESAAASPGLAPHGVGAGGGTLAPASGPAATLAALSGGARGAAEGSPSSLGSGSMRERFRKAQARQVDKDKDKDLDKDSSLGSIGTLSASGSPVKPTDKAGTGTLAELGESLDSSTGSASAAGAGAASPGGHLSASERFKMRRLQKDQGEKRTQSSGIEGGDTSTSDLEKSLEAPELDEVTHHLSAAERRHLRQAEGGR